MSKYKSTIETLIKYLLNCLEEIDNANETIEYASFIHGEKTAYVDCLEILQNLDDNCEFGLDFDIEKRYEI